ncbi:MAG: ATP-binding protein, partial [Xanthobacteraceae bacterium]|nr:ATP-binding protein [Xanthobacteraceae bacterium]
AQADTPPPTAPNIINDRIAWDAAAATPTPASPQQIAALNARGVHLGDPQSTAGLSKKVSEAMAYAPPALLDRTKIVAASAPLPISSRLSSLTSGPMSVNVATIAAKALPGQQSPLATMARLTSPAQMSDVWLRAMILTPDVSSALSVSILGDQDMTAMSAHFTKPERAVAMTFSEDPQLGVVCDRFTGSAIATLETTSFVQRTASLR